MSRMTWFAAALAALLYGCATMDPQSEQIVMEEALVPSDPGISVYVSLFREVQLFLDEAK